MDSSLSQKIRKQLDAPLSQKNIFFYLLFPILILASFVVSVFASYRRKKSYQKRENLNIDQKNLKIICVGNVSIGGSGKSPIVQSLAREYLERGFVVGIAARGITDTKEPVFVSSAEKKDKNFYEKLKKLSDENREHYELLSTNAGRSSFYILQNKDRSQALRFFANEVQLEKAILILDDGLQHFACPRDVNLCVWQPDLLRKSPKFAMPLGPYREGFGKKSFQRLLNQFDFRIWSRTREDDFFSFVENTRQALSQFQLGFTEKDIFCCYEFQVLKVKFEQNEYIFDKADEKTILNTNDSPAVLTGIAYPEKFLGDLKCKFPHLENLAQLFLEDHASLNLKSKEFLKKNKLFFFTMKDFLRWIQDEDFISELKDKEVYVCRIDIEFYSPERVKSNISKNI